MSALIIDVAQCRMLIVPLSTLSFALFFLTNRCFVRAQFPPFLTNHIVDVLSWCTSIGPSVNPNSTIIPLNHSANVEASHSTIHSDSVEESVTILSLNDFAYNRPVPIVSRMQPCPLPSSCIAWEASANISGGCVSALYTIAISGLVSIYFNNLMLWRMCALVQSLQCVDNIPTVNSRSGRVNLARNITLITTDIYSLRSICSEGTCCSMLSLQGVRPSHLEFSNRCLKRLRTSFL